MPKEFYDFSSFNQIDLQKTYPSIKRGVCVGLAIDFARFELNNQHDVTANYVKKLNKKIAERSVNFENRINQYQQLQPINVSSANIKPIPDYVIKKRNFTQFFGEVEGQPNVLGILSFKESKGIRKILDLYTGNSGHIFALSIIRDDNKKPIGYKLFDSNMYLKSSGSSHESNKTNIDFETNLDIGWSIFATVDSDVKAYYCNLDELIKEGQLSKNKKNYNKSDKYLDEKTYKMSIFSPKLQLSLYGYMFMIPVIAHFSKNVKVKLFSALLPIIPGLAISLGKCNIHLLKNSSFKEFTCEEKPCSFSNNKFYYNFLGIHIPLNPSNVSKKANLVEEPKLNKAIQQDQSSRTWVNRVSKTSINRYDKNTNTNNR